MSWMSRASSTKRIQPARGWCATVPQSGGLSGGTLCKLYPHTPPLRRPGRPVFWGSQPCVPAAWLAERLLLAGDIESNPGPKPTLKTLTHTRTQPPTLTKYTNSSIQPPQTRPPQLSLVHPPPKTPTSVQPPKTTYTSFPPAPTLTPYTVVVRLSVHVHFSLGLPPRDS